MTFFEEDQLTQKQIIKALKERIQELEEYRDHIENKITDKNDQIWKLAVQVSFLKKKLTNLRKRVKLKKL